jgi:hypothetical protein
MLKVAIFMRHLCQQGGEDHSPFVTLNIAAPFCFAQRHKATKKEDWPTGPFPIDGAAGPHGRKGKPLHGRRYIFVALCLCAKQKGAAMFRVTKGL